MITNDFSQQFAVNRQKETILPFLVGGATRYGDLKNLGMNQDAIGIDIGDKFISGVVADGCSSPHPESLSSYSCNEVASRLTSIFILQAIRQVISRNGIGIIEFPEQTSSLIFEKYIKAIYKCSSWEGRGRESREISLYNYLMSTALFFIVSESHFIICAFGDGVVATNLGMFLLKDESGKYPVNYLLQAIKHKKKPIFDGKSFPIVYSGDTSSLSFIYLATDGFYKLFETEFNLLKQFAEVDSNNCSTGYDKYFLRNFRKHIIYPLYESKFRSIVKAQDDQSVICLRRQTRKSNEKEAQ